MIRRIFSILVIVSFVLVGLSGCSSKKGAKDGEQGLGEGDLNGITGDNITSGQGDSMFRKIYFAYDSSSVSDRARQDIEYNAQVLQSNTGMRIALEGHTDERGTTEYNLALGERRARAVMDVLVSCGISRSRLNTLSYGEEVPVDPGHDESAWSKNRRVVFSASAGRGGEVR